MASTQLAKYRGMRDFSVTAEPSGERAVKPSEALRFVIQKHDATRLHFDLRLEWGRRFPVLGDAEGAFAESARPAAGGGGRGPPPRLWRLRGDHP